MPLDAQRVVIHLTEAVASTRGPAGRSRLVLRAMCELTGAFGGGIVAYQPSSGKLSVDMHAYDVDASEMARIHRSHAYYVPRFFAAGLGQRLLANVPRAFTPAEVLGADTWRTCEFREAHLRPFGLEGMVVITSLEQDSVWAMVLVPPRGKHIRPERVNLVQAVAPHLGRVLSRLLHSPDAWLRASALEVLVACNRGPIVALRLGDKSKPAQLLGATGGAAEIVRLRRVTASHNLDLAELLRLCPTALRLDTGSVVWTAHDGRMYALKAARVSADPTSLVVHLKALSAPDTEGSADVAAARACGLSVRRAEVFALVAHGLTNRQIGLALRISPNTARTHVSKLIKTLGVSGRVEAINKVRSEARAQADGSDGRA
ncbi:MAG: LuxR C-terminal-related transcriptional regulator [Planctomycetota bacterium]|nr:LuxR C-terminal-related transcriptional regulator [Planctomycetota bacterium]